MKLLVNCFFLAVWMLMSINLHAAEKVVELTTLDWPPYTSEALADGGISVAVVKAAFAAVGYQAKITFHSWTQTVALAKGEGKVMGYFPEYMSDELKDSFYLSDAMPPVSPLGFIENTGKPIKWEKLADLKNNSIATVKGYVNTAEFDAMVAKKELNVMEAHDDETNIRRVAAGRLDLAVIDKNVFNNLLDKKLASLKDKVRFQDNKVLENKKLYLCFRKTPEGDELRKAFNEGLKKIDMSKLTQMQK